MEEDDQQPRRFRYNLRSRSRRQSEGSHATDQETEDGDETTAADNLATTSSSRQEILGNQRADDTITEQPSSSSESDDQFMLFERPSRRRGSSSYKSLLEAVPLNEYQVRNRPDVEFGGKVFLPEDVLTQRVMFFETQEDQHQVPLLFKLQSQDDPEVCLHCGVWEFTAEPGRVQMPRWMMDRLGGGQMVKVSSSKLPKARGLTVRPVTDSTHDANLMDLPDIKAVLETRLKTFSALAVNEVVPIEFGGRVYLMEVVTATPDTAEDAAVDITEVNVEIDFALSEQEERDLKAKMDEFYWTNWQPGQGLRFFRKKQEE